MNEQINVITNEQINAITLLALSVANTFGFGEVIASEDTYVTIGCDCTPVANSVYDAMEAARSVLGAAAISSVAICGKNVTIWRS